MKSVKEAEVKNKTVILRTDFNVPVENKEVKDDFRIRAALPTIKYLSEQGAKILIVCHLGRPGGKEDPELSLKPIAKYLEGLLEEEIVFYKNLEEVKEKLTELQPGNVGMTENIRYYKEERYRNKDFAQNLSALGDIYVNDAFGVSHRKHTSVYLLPTIMPAYAGLLMEKEVAALDKVRSNQQKPFTFLMGGAKVSTKIKTLAHIWDRVDNVCLGGLIANTILAFKGMSVGKSKYEKGMEKYLEKLNITNTKLHLPVDAVLAKNPSHTESARISGIAEVKEEDMILDIGPDTIELYSDIIKRSKKIVWNGPMGVSEVPEFAKGTYQLAEALKENKGAFTVVGGGNVMAALDEVSASQYIDHTSTGGGAMLEYIAEGTLPAIRALE